MYSACQVILFKNPWDLNRFNVIPHFLGWYVRVPSVWLLLSKWYDSALVLCLWVRSCCLGIRYVTVVAVLLTHKKKRKGKKKITAFPKFKIMKSWPTSFSLQPAKLTFYPVHTNQIPRLISPDRIMSTLLCWQALFCVWKESMNTF